MKKSCFILFVSVISYNYAQTPVTTVPNWSVTNLTPNNVLNFPTEITFGPDGFLRITERVRKKMVRVNKTNGVFKKSSNENLQEITVFDVLGRKLYNFQNINLTIFRTTKLSNQTQTLLI